MCQVDWIRKMFSWYLLWAIALACATVKAQDVAESKVTGPLNSSYHRFANTLIAQPAPGCPG